MARLEGFRGPKLSEFDDFRAIKFSRLENCMTIMYFGQIGVFQDPHFEITPFSTPKSHILAYDKSGISLKLANFLVKLLLF